MRRAFAVLVLFLSVFGVTHSAERVVNIDTRDGVTQGFLVIPAAGAKSAVILFAGGHGGLRISDSGSLQWGKGNFLVRSAPLFGAHQLTVAIVDAPSDRQSDPYLGGFRQTAEHAADIRRVIAWLRENSQVPVWLIGTSRGTQSAAAVATRLPAGEGPDGIVLTASILRDPRGRPVPDIALDQLKTPVLVVHHEDDACRSTLYRDVPRLMERLANVPRKELVTVRGGESTGNPCAGMSHHGFNGIEADVVRRIAEWITSG